MFHTNSTLLFYRFQNRLPNQVTFYLPEWETADRPTDAFYAQDSWTRGRLTRAGCAPLRSGVELQSWRGQRHASHLALQRRADSAGGTEGVHTYRDVSPRIGVAYDVFGNGKTAVKFNLGRYVTTATNDAIYAANNPSTRIVTSASRSWSDTNQNFVVDCDLLNPAAQPAPAATPVAR